MNYALIALRLTAGAAGTAFGAYCAMAAYSNGVAMKPGTVESYLIGAAGVASVVFSWFALSAAWEFIKVRNWPAAAFILGGWVLALVFILMNSTSYTASNRTSQVGFKTDVITRYDAAVQGLASERKALALVEKDERYAKTAGCTNATVEKSKTFCNNVALIKSNIASYINVVNTTNRPATADAGAENVAWVIGWAVTLAPESIGRFVAVYWAVIADLLSSICWFIAFSLPSSAPKRKEAVAEAKVAAADFGPLWVALGEAQAALALIAQAKVALEAAEVGAAQARTEVRFTQLRRAWNLEAALTEGWSQGIEIVAQPVVAAPVKQETKKVAKVEAKAAPKRRRDGKGRFAKKAKLVAVTEAPVSKPKLSAVPLAGSENVVIFPGHKD